MVLIPSCIHCTSGAKRSRGDAADAGALLILMPRDPLISPAIRRTRSTDSDNNPKLVHVSYDQAKGKGDEEGKAGGKLVVEKTDQVMGSCAGAG